MADEMHRDTRDERRIGVEERRGTGDHSLDTREDRFGDRTRDERDENPHFRDRDDSTPVTTTEPPRAVVRGGVSFPAILTGVLTAFGVMMILSAVVGGIMIASDITTRDIAASTPLSIGIAAGIALVAAQFLSYFWGGYTAGRMARGAGAVNGLLVPLMAIVIAAIAGLVTAAFGAEARLNMPFQPVRLAVDADVTVRYGIGLGIVAFVAMLVGGLLGGIRGATWHRRLEDANVEHPRARVSLD